MSTGMISWSTTAASNATADSTVNWAEGMAPSAVNDSARAEMASAAKFLADIKGGITTGGTSTAYTVTSNQTHTATVNGPLAFVPHTTNGATVTIAVDSIGAKPLRSAPGVELPAGVLIAGTPYTATYYTTNSGEWILHGFYSNPYSIPIGGIIPYTCSATPNSSFVFAYGQAINRSTYSAYFTLVATLYGVGDGSTTFNVPDLRGRGIFGIDNMGGSAANRLTSAGSGINGLAFGGVGGAENVTIAQANFPNVNFVNSGISASITNGNVTVGVKSNGASSGAGAASAVGSVDAATNSVAANSGTIGVSIDAQGVSNSGGSGTALNKMPPTIVLPFILRII